MVQAYYHKLYPYEGYLADLQTWTKERSARLILCDHKPLVTTGRNLEEGEEIFRNGPPLPTFAIGRGGQATYHLPDQTVMYPIFDLRANKILLGDLIQALQKAALTLVHTLAGPDFEFYMIAGKPGIYLNEGKTMDAKVGSIGLAVSKMMTTHGFAVNIHNDMEPVNHVIACGEPSREARSLKEFVPDLKLNQANALQSIDTEMQIEIIEGGPASLHYGSCLLFMYYFYQELGWI